VRRILLDLVDGGVHGLLVQLRHGSRGGSHLGNELRRSLLDVPVGDARMRCDVGAKRTKVFTSPFLSAQPLPFRQESACLPRQREQPLLESAEAAVDLARLARGQIPALLERLVASRLPLAVNVSLKQPRQRIAEASERCAAIAPRRGERLVELTLRGRSRLPSP